LLSIDCFLDGLDLEKTRAVAAKVDWMLGFNRDGNLIY
jgi:hypothetical protein